MVVSVAIGNKLLLLPHVAILTQSQNVTDIIGFGGIVWPDLKNARKNMRFGTRDFSCFFSDLFLGKLGL